MAFPTVPLVETFTGTTGTTPPNSNWTNFNDGVKLAAGNRVTGASSGGPGIAYWNAATMGPDCELFIDIYNKPDNNSGSVNLYMIQLASTDGYTIEYDENTSGTDATYLWRFDALSGIQLGSTFFEEYNDGDGLGLEKIGDQISAYRRSSGVWNLLFTETDSDHDYSNFSPVLGITNDYAILDNMGFGTHIPPVVGENFIQVAMHHYTKNIRSR